MENPWSTFVVIQNREVTFREKQKLGKVAVDDDVSLLFSENWPEKVLSSSMFYFGKFFIKEGKKVEFF